jgi:chromosome segregation ATPase
MTATPSPLTAKANAKLDEYKNDFVHFSTFSKKQIGSSPMEGSKLENPLPSQQSLHATISMLQDEVKMLRKRLQFATDELKRREVVNQTSPSHEMKVLRRQLEVEKEKARFLMSSPELEQRRSPAFSAEAALMAQCRVLADQLKTAKLETAQLRKDLASTTENAAETKVIAESVSSAKQKLEYELGQAARELQSMEIDLERSMKRVTDLSADNKELRRMVRQQEESLRELLAVNADKTTQIANLESKVSLLLRNSPKQENPSNAQSLIVEDKPALSQDKALGELHKELENKNRRVMCLIEELEKERRRVAELQRQVWDQAIEIDELHGERRKNFETEAEVVRLRGKVECLEEALSHARKGAMTAQVDTATKRKEGRLKEQSDVFDDVFELYSGKRIARNGDQGGAEETWLMDANS